MSMVVDGGSDGTGEDKSIHMEIHLLTGGLGNWPQCGTDGNLVTGGHSFGVLHCLEYRFRGGNN